MKPPPSHGSSAGQSSFSPQGEGNRKRCRGFRVRTAGFELPPASLIKLDEATSMVSPEPLLLQMARIATPLELAMLVCELCGLYAIQPGGELVQREVPLTSIGRIVEFLANLGGIPGAPALRRVASVAFELSASPQESKLAARVAWDRARGGYAIPILGMNESLEVRRINERLDRPVRKTRRHPAASRPRRPRHRA